MNDNPPLLFQILFTLVISIIGIVGINSFLNPKFLKWNIKFNNEIQGIKTKITPRTILVGRIMSLVVFFTAILFLFFTYSIIF